MASTIKVDKIEGSTGSTITVPTGQTFTITDGVGVASGGTGLSSFAAGDLLYATGATTLAKLAKPASTQVLQMTSGGTPSWVDAGGGGLLQLKQSQVTDSSSRGGSLTFGAVDTDLDVVITPTLSTSKMLVSVSMQASSDNYVYWQLVREVASSDTEIAKADASGSSIIIGTIGNTVYNSDDYTGGTATIEWLDAPATTSEITYKLFVSNHATVYFNRSEQSADNTSAWRSVATMTVKEIAVGVL